MAMSVTELGLNKVVARRVIPKVTFMPSTEITGIDEHDVHVRGFLSGEKSVLEGRSEEHTSELQSLMRISYAVFCLKKKNRTYTHDTSQRDIQKRICIA